MTRMGVTGALAACQLLGACNAVVSKTPLFSRADEAGAPSLKPGLWRMSDDPDCPVEESKPLVEWPKCAGGLVIKDGVAGYYDRDSGAPVWSTQPIVLTAGDPRIAQAQAAVSGDVKMDFRPYIYAGVRSDRTDNEGRIVALSLWPVQCGPPPAGDSADGTAHPLAGMEMEPGDPVCTTTSPNSLRAAAKASLAWSPKLLTAHWVRTADPQTPSM